MSFSFSLHKKDFKTRARRGVVRTPHGEIQTPVFMPVGTMASVKTLDLADLRALNPQIILGNTYHLMLRPGVDVFTRFGGIRAFTGWKGPVLTDSGGFQIFCLPTHRKINEKGATFRSYVDGAYHMLSPEKSIDVQSAIGSDIMMVLDWCIDSTSSYAHTREAMEMTHKWALRSLNRAIELRDGSKPYQAAFAIVQGGVFEELRKQSSAFLTDHPFDGFAIGGLAVGETKTEREDMTELVAQTLPEDKPRYLMGVGTPIDLLEAVYRGVDMFDCVIPTMYGQRGKAYTSTGKVNLLATALRFSDEKLDAECDCATCAHYSRGYLHHLMKCREPTGWRLVAIHNLVYYHKLMREIREAIDQDRYEEFYLLTKAKIAPANLLQAEAKEESSILSV
jgi:queuine tRNA-ribosyltransferase